MRTRKAQRRARLIASLIVGFYATGVAYWWFRHGPSEVGLLAARPIEEPHVAAARSATPHGPTAAASADRIDGVISELRQRDVRMPIDGTDVERVKGSFVEMRSHGGHEAVDILAPRNTPVHAVEDGSIAKLFLSKAGGNTIYQYDPTKRFCYYYAHLERYANGLRDGQRVARGDVIGYVGTSGNARPGTPHLHFAVFELGEDQHWWVGRAVDPYLVFHH